MVFQVQISQIQKATRRHTTGFLKDLVIPSQEDAIIGQH